MGAKKQNRLLDLSVSREIAPNLLVSDRTSGVLGQRGEETEKQTRQANQTVRLPVALNSARRVKCDEAKPACKKCVSGGRTCQGYEDPFVASSPPWPAKIDGTSMSRRASSESNKEWQVTVSRPSAIKAVSPFRVQDLEPFECDFAQCAKYYKNVSIAACNIRNINRPRFIIHTTAEYLNRISISQNALPSSALVPAVRNQWTKFHRNAIIVNTTSPASNQIMPVYEFRHDEIEAVFSLRFYSELPCPTVLFLCMHRITKLRMRLADGEPAAEIQPLAEIILDKVEAFDSQTWSEPYGVPENTVFRTLARAYQAAVRLYAIMTMPPCLSVVTGEMYRKEPAREELMGLIREVLPQLESKVTLHWCLPVAGVALADGPVEDQEFLEYIFMGLKQEVEFYLPFHIRDTLKAFWASGLTGWEDCWTEPYPPLC
ncbi:hypothetical protein PWT90_10829 [Aphanocladium album]|nr:hypothetical protein PWT90_10829 [Aphanocladium album]